MGLFSKTKLRMLGVSEEDIEVFTRAYFQIVADDAVFLEIDGLVGHWKTIKLNEGFYASK